MREILAKTSRKGELCGKNRAACRLSSLVRCNSQSLPSRSRHRERVCKRRSLAAFQAPADSGFQLFCASFARSGELASPELLCTSTDFLAQLFEPDAAELVLFRHQPQGFANHLAGRAVKPGRYLLLHHIFQFWGQADIHNQELAENIHFCQSLAKHSYRREAERELG